MNELSWLQRHERIVLSLLAGIVFLFLGNWWINHSADVAVAKANAATQVAKADADNNSKLAAIEKADADRYAQLYAQVNAQNTQLQGEILSLENQLVKQKKIDQTLPLPALVSRWQDLTGLKTNEFNSGSITYPVSITENGARTTVSSLEELPVLKQEVAADNTMLSNKDNQLLALTGLNGDLSHQVTGLEKTVLDNSKACEAQRQAITATNRKGKRSAFLKGLATGAGIVTALVAHFAL